MKGFRIAVLLFAGLFIAGCFGDATGPGNDDEEPTGEFSATVTGAENSSFSGGLATFASGESHLAVDLLSQDSTRAIHIRGEGMVEGGEPATGTYTLETVVQGEAGENSATYVNVDSENLYGSRSGTMQITSVSEQWVEGEFEFVATDPFAEQQVTVSGSFEAVCNALTGRGEC